MCLSYSGFKVRTYHCPGHRDEHARLRFHVRVYDCPGQHQEHARLQSMCRSYSGLQRGTSNCPGQQDKHARLRWALTLASRLKPQITLGRKMSMRGCTEPLIWPKDENLRLPWTAWWACKAALCLYTCLQVRNLWLPWVARWACKAALSLYSGLQVRIFDCPRQQYEHAKLHSPCDRKVAVIWTRVFENTKDRSFCLYTSSRE